MGGVLNFFGAEERGRRGLGREIIIWVRTAKTHTCFCGMSDSSAWRLALLSWINLSKGVRIIFTFTLALLPTVEARLWDMIC